MISLKVTDFTSMPTGIHIKDLIKMVKSMVKGCTRGLMGILTKLFLLMEERMELVPISGMASISMYLMKIKIKEVPKMYSLIAKI